VNAAPLLIGPRAVQLGLMMEASRLIGNVMRSGWKNGKSSYYPVDGTVALHMYGNEWIVRMCMRLLVLIKWRSFAFQLGMVTLVAYCLNWS